MQISTRLCPHRVYFYARSRKTRLKSSFANAVGNGIYICEVTFAVLSQRATTGTMCRACYTKRSCKRMTLVYIPTHLPLLSRKLSITLAFPAENATLFLWSFRFISNSALPVSASSGEKNWKLSKTPLKNRRTTKRKI